MTPCIETTYYKHKQGYGQVQRNGKNYFHHRLVYAQHHGLTIEQLEGISVRHTCDNTSCINPEHLIPGTHQDNMSDMLDRGRSKIPAKSLTTSQVLEIQASRLSMKELCRKYEVSYDTIYRCRHHLGAYSHAKINASK